MHLGRTIESIEKFSVDLGINNYLISGNGAAVYDIKNQKVIYSKFLNKEQVLQIYVRKIVYIIMYIQKMR